MVWELDLQNLPELSTAEVAGLLHVTPDTVRQEIIRGRLKAHRVGLRKYFVSQSEVARYLSQNSTAAVAGAAR